MSTAIISPPSPWECGHLCPPNPPNQPDQSDQSDQSLPSLKSLTSLKSLPSLPSFPSLPSLFQPSALQAFRFSGARPRAPSAFRPSAFSPSGFQIFLLICSLALSTTATAQTQLVTLIDKRPVVIEVPPPFVEVSRILPEAFALRAARVPTNRLLAWFISARDLKDQLNDKPDHRYRSLQIQVMKEMEIVRYDSDDVAKLRADTLAGESMRLISEGDADTLFSLLDLRQITQRAGGRMILGMADLGPDSFTICVATRMEGRDQRGGYEIETSITCVTSVLVTEKVLQLVVSCPELSAKELRNAMGLTRDWIARLRAENNMTPPSPAQQPSSTTSKILKR